MEIRFLWTCQLSFCGLLQKKLSVKQEKSSSGNSTTIKLTKNEVGIPAIKSTETGDMV